ncbi:MAG: hypothetical protein OSB23_09305 [Porticoccaceae bacterium]|nr:hypothetical protein [Porticoccaceae bacterium]
MSIDNIAVTANESVRFTRKKNEAMSGSVKAEVYGSMIKKLLAALVAMPLFNRIFFNTG